MSEITATVFSPALDCACSVGQKVFILGSGERLAIAAEETRCFPFCLFILLLLFCWFLHLFSSLPCGQSYFFWYFSLPWTCYYFFPTHLKGFTVTLPAMSNFYLDGLPMANSCSIFYRTLCPVLIYLTCEHGNAGERLWLAGQHNFIL